MKKINLNAIENDKMMSPYEMKNVTGGSTLCTCTCNYGNETFTQECNCAGDPKECENYDLPYGCFKIEC